MGQNQGRRRVRPHGVKGAQAPERASGISSGKALHILPTRDEGRALPFAFGRPNVRTRRWSTRYAHAWCSTPLQFQLLRNLAIWIRVWDVGFKQRASAPPASTPVVALHRHSGTRRLQPLLSLRLWQTLRFQPRRRLPRSLPVLAHLRVTVRFPPARSRRFGVPLHATRNPDRSLLSRTLSKLAQPGSVSHLSSLSNMGSHGPHWRRYGFLIRMDTIGPTTLISIGFICSLPEQDRPHHLPLTKFYPEISFHSYNMNETLARLSQP